jgi:hypothetical protein
MRTSLFHRVEPRRNPRGTRALPRLRCGPIRTADAIHIAEEPSKTSSGEQAPPTVSQATGTDAAVDRVQAAGGPIDQATYECSCGLLFSAPVSTTVCCPHCGAEQAW